MLVIPIAFFSSRVILLKSCFTASIVNFSFVKASLFSSSANSTAAACAFLTAAILVINPSVSSSLISCSICLFSASPASAFSCCSICILISNCNLRNFSCSFIAFDVVSMVPSKASATAFAPSLILLNESVTLEFLRSSRRPFNSSSRTSIFFIALAENDTNLAAFNWRISSSMPAIKKGAETAVVKSITPKTTFLIPSKELIRLFMKTFAVSENLENPICKASAPSLLSPKTLFNSSKPLAKMAIIPSFPRTELSPLNAFSYFPTLR